MSHIPIAEIIEKIGHHIGILRLCVRFKSSAHVVQFCFNAILMCLKQLVQVVVYVFHLWIDFCRPEKNQWHEKKPLYMKLRNKLYRLRIYTGSVTRKILDSIYLISCSKNSTAVSSSKLKAKKIHFIAEKLVFRKFLVINKVAIEQTQFDSSQICIKDKMVYAAVCFFLSYRPLVGNVAVRECISDTVQCIENHCSP